MGPRTQRVNPHLTDTNAKGRGHRLAGGLPPAQPPATLSLPPPTTPTTPTIKPFWLPLAVGTPVTSKHRLLAIKRIQSAPSQDKRHLRRRQVRGN
ncbi:hypothetical protein EKO04_007572 [Ascochyta lentis]|uniref:Uncharacterized protein n=1 Tax=Ascochyta lentis TaxID=205686 RepID=A0A8H7IZZ2_9PLEO|nr:hypothetical protein EKO04_007572 [Ascochyta lentis]